MGDFLEDRYPHREVTERIIAAAMEVHGMLGAGFTEPVYQEALEIVFPASRRSVRCTTELVISYKDHELKKRFRPDFVVESLVIAELKASSTIVSEDQRQLLNYLKAARFKVGLLLNFGAPSLEIKRTVCSSVKSA